MPSIWKRPESKYYYCCYTDHTGKQRKCSSKTTIRREAMKMAESLEEGYRRKIAGMQARRLISGMYEEIHGQALMNHTAGDFLRNWSEGKRHEVAASTYERYRVVIGRFIEFLGDKAEQDLAFIGSEDVKAFRDHIADGLSNKTANNYLKVLRGALNEAVAMELATDNPATRVKVLSVGDGERRSFNMSEIGKLLEVADPEWRGMIIFGLYTGQRLGDIAKLTWAHVDMENDLLSLTTGKTKRRVVIPLADSVKAYLAETEAQGNSGAPLFPRAFNTAVTQKRVGTLSNQFYKIMVRAELAPKRSTHAQKDGRSGKRQSNPLSFHCLRHTATSMLKNAGVSEAVAMDIIGHDSKAVSSTYTHIETEAKREAMAKLPNINV